MQAAEQGINWDAVSAIGTVGAVIAALWIAGAEGRRAKRDGRARAVWVKEEFRKPIGLWLANAKGAKGLIVLGQEHNLYLLLTKPTDRCYPFRIPSQITDLRGYLQDLGDAGQHVASAVGLARRLETCEIVAVLRNQYTDHRQALDIKAEFNEDLDHLIEALEQAMDALKLDRYKGADRRHPRRKVMDLIKQ
ncbi:hypothetical protein [Stenotrophomonas sp.]|uniref:hypothetical protein n=1 Tax=Stenotrophomonas sp. TaxID=69392 RepID=UPI00289DD0B3|nr:hypothetical protein [Stenotrophomonas sp.]